MNSRWTMEISGVGGHRYYRNVKNGCVAVADASGPDPESTDDGILWLDETQKVRLVPSRDGFAGEVALRNARGERVWTCATMAEIEALVERYHLALDASAFARLLRLVGGGRADG